MMYYSTQWHKQYLNSKDNLLNFLIDGLQIMSNKSIDLLSKLPKEKIIRIY